MELQVIGKIGRMMRELREQRHIAQAALGRKIISTPELSRIENGEKEPDIFTLEALLQRLGKSLRLFELLLSEKEFQLLELREKIQDSIRVGNYTEADVQLKLYMERTKGKKVVHTQYSRMICGVLAYMQNENKEEGLRILGEALEMSFSEEREVWETPCLSLQELQILLFMGCMNYEVGNTGRAFQLLERMQCYVRENYTSEDLLEVTEPMCNYLSEQFQMGRKRLIAMEHIILKLLFLNVPCRAFLESELIVRTRKAQGYTQDSLSSGVCARETLSNIEHGRKSNPKKRKLLLDKIGVRQNKYYSYIMADSFEVYELLYRYETGLFRQDFAEMERVFSGLEKRLDKTLPENRKFLAIGRLLQGIRKKKMNEQEVILRLEGLLKQTMPEYAGGVCRIPYREEFLLLFQLICSLKEFGRVTEAVTICETMRRQYMESRGVMLYRQEELLLLYQLYVEVLKASGLHGTMELYRQEWRELVLRHHRGRGEFLNYENNSKLQQF